VGAFADGMNQLQQQGWVNPLKDAVLNQQIPLLGICLGMQLLADYGYEGARTPGLGLLPGEVRYLERQEPTERIPHVGWNEVNQQQPEHELFQGIPDRADFYFVHSYHFIPANQEHVLATTPYCGTIVSAVSSGLIFGTQFHPEKSSKNGLRLLQNFLKIRVLDHAS
jgi:glutamine amidotransferase